jgi:metallo-beta-lactamase family protein
MGRMKDKILHHGAVDGVTGSCHQLFWSEKRSILIDCGLFQGTEAAPDGSHFDQLKINFPVDQIDALVVTHVHIDHVGRIPYLLAAGFTGPIYCSEPSAHLLPLVLEDALKIGFTRNQRLIGQFLKQIKQQIQPLPYKQWQKVGSESGTQLRIKLQEAGHILGSAYIECDLKTGSQRERITFSGDLGAPYSPLLSAPRSPYRSDTLILESTYGDKNHQGRRERRNQLLKIIKRAVRNSGVILIPAFSIGRTQELLYELEELIHREEIDFEVLVDSPLAAKFTETYRALKPYWDREAKQKLKRGRHPLAFDQLWTIDNHETHQQTVEYLKKTAKPTIVIAASGMCSGGRIVNYLKALIEDKRTDILFVGYQAQGTAGRAIQKYGPRGGWVELDGKRYTINAETYTVSGYSAHADQKNLTNFIKRMRYKPKEVRLVHGDENAKKSLQQRLNTLLPQSKVWIP